MGNSIVFYHFNTKNAMESTSIKDTDIAFCKETETIRVGNIDYMSFDWSEIPKVSVNEPEISNDKLILPDSVSVEENVCLLNDTEYQVNESTLIIS